MITLVFCLEERSAMEMLEGILPRLLKKKIQTHYLIFEGKQDMDKRLGKRIGGWIKPHARFVTIRDQDSGDCRLVKQKLVDICSRIQGKEILVCIACRELESFYLGDLGAVEIGLEITGLGKKQKKSKFREPDGIANPSKELMKLTKHKYQKISGSRAIGKQLSLQGNRSHSFRVLLQGIEKYTMK